MTVLRKAIGPIKKLVSQWVVVCLYFQSDLIKTRMALLAAFKHSTEMEKQLKI